MKKTLSIYSWISVVLLIFFLNLNSVYAGEAQPPEKNLEVGKALYQKNCAQCHGDNGDGKGVSEPFVFPKPRDFTAGLYKIRTTPGGQLPLDSDLFRTISLGMPGSSMPAWQQLSEADRWQLVHYIKTFSPKFGSETPEKIPTTPKPAKPDLEKGRQLFQDIECWKCHGQEGRGDGPSAPELKDNWGLPIKPADLTKNWTFRGGGSVEDIYMRIITGINGTPMPAFLDSFEKPEDAWDLAYYVRSLSPENKPEVTVLRAQLIQGELPTEPEDPRWNELPAHYFPLSGQITMEPRLFTPSIDSIFVKAVHNTKEIAFLVMWNDRTQDPSPPGSTPQTSSAEGQQSQPASQQGNPSAPQPGSPQKFSDAVAIQFPVKPDPGGFIKPYFIMGDSERPVYLWTWKAEWQGVKESNANGPFKETLQSQESQTLQGKGVYKNGQWKVIFKRTLTTDDKDHDYQFEAGKFIPIAFSAWDGSNGETELKKSLSTWYYLFLEAPKPISQYLYPLVTFLIIAGAEVWFLKRNNPRR
jgi:mono/diheme cytochrome c family protein